MAREIPEPVRAAAGLAATLLDEARKLPSTLPALPVRALGLVMQTSLKLQQEYSGLVARGDEVFTGLRGDAEPGLATFDDDLPGAPPPVGNLGSRTSSFDRVAADPVDSFDDEHASAGGPPPTVVDEAAAIGEDDLTDETLAEEELLAEGLTADLGDADLTDAEVAGLPGDPQADDITSTVDELAANMSDNAAEDDALIAASERAIEHTDDAAGPGVSEEPEGGSDLSGSQAAGASPIDGYDGFTIAQLRGRLRGYQPVTVEELLAYEQATRNRTPYVTLLRNRKEKLDRERG